ncbi:MAG TPA: hypothetical protein VKO84_07195 [Gaiellaceae bacterium]|nr:hypothetical protein [Gaiellaceae bacterium]
MAAAAAFADRAPNANGRAVLQGQYAHCTDTEIAPAINQDCWAFSMNPSGMFMTVTGAAATSYLILVDPTSGKVLLDQISSK